MGLKAFRSRLSAGAARVAGFLPRAGTRTLVSVPSMFGRLKVAENRATRRLMLDGQSHGVAWLEPTASAAAAGLGGPGPVAESAYMVGWLLAGARAPGARALMVGLGAGVGAASLLYNFPRIQLTVVEIDPVVVELATEYFPLVEHYRRAGRLRIVQSDAAEFLKREAGPWDLAMGDAFVSGGRLAGGFILPMIRSAATAYVNCMGPLGGGDVRQVIGAFREAGRPATEALRTVRRDLPLGESSNWIVTNSAADAVAERGFVAYDGLHGPGPDQARSVLARALARNFLGAFAS